MRASAAFPSKYLRATDIGDRQVKVIMSHVEIESVGQGNEAEHKPVVYFEKSKKGMVLNKTNAEILARAYGDEMDDWSGKEVIIYVAEVQFKKEMVEALRLKVPKPTQPIRPISDPPPATSLDDYGADMNDEIPF